MKKLVMVAVMLAVSSSVYAQSGAFDSLKGDSSETAIQFPTPTAAPSPSEAIPSQLESAVNAAIKSAIDYAVKTNNAELELALRRFDAIAPFQDKYEFVYHTEGYHLRNYVVVEKGLCQWICDKVTQLVCKQQCDPLCHDDCNNIVVDACKYVNC